MISYLKHREIDKAKWDSCISNAQYSIIYGYSWYLDVISPQWQGLVKDDYEAVFPLTWNKKFGVYYLYQPAFAQQLGIFSKGLITPCDIEAFFAAIPGKFIHIDITLNPSNQKPSPKYSCRPKITLHLPLNKPYPVIFEGYRADTKRTVKKGHKNGLEIKNIEVEKVIALYRQNVWHKTPGVKPADFETLKKLIAQLHLFSQCRVLGVFLGETLSAGGILFIMGNKIIFIFGASNPLGRKNGAMRHLFDTIVQEFAGKEMVLDFEGSATISVRHFYESFGPETVAFDKICYTKNKWLGKLVRLKQKLIK